jgi:hypothetical protein
MIDLFGNDTPYAEKGRLNPRTRYKSGAWKVNPMTLKFGTTEGKRCKHCVHLVVKQYAGRYFKCALRGNVNKTSPASDHRANWPVCGHFEPSNESTQ